MTTSGAASYYIKDHLGSVRAVVNSSGTVLETRDFYPYGLEMPGRSYLSGTKAKENFTGHERDAETGMLYAGARYYMPNVGRWTSVDPLAARSEERRVGKGGRAGDEEDLGRVQEAR